MLDNRRLNKQKLEASQIISSFETESKAYSNHPASKAWIGFIPGLKYYTNCMIDEWVARGFNNTLDKYSGVDEKTPLPWFYTNKQVHYAYMSSLKRKDPEFYAHFEYPSEYDSIGYIWVSKLNEKVIEKMKKGEEIELSECCSPMGKGLPSHFHFTEEETKKWSENKLVNPKTGRKITEGKGLYIDLKKAFEYYSSKME